MQPNPYNYNSSSTVRFAVPPGYRPQNVPPVANLSYDRYANISTGVQPPVNPVRPINYSVQPNGMRMPNGFVAQPPPQSTSGARLPDQMKPPEPYYYNPYGAATHGFSPTPSSTQTSKKGSKEYKDSAFTIKPDGAEGDAIRGLVSNDDINKLLTHKGTKVKVSKIYRITKTKSDAVVMDSSDEDVPPPPPPPPPAERQTPAVVPAAVPPPAPRSGSRSSSSSCSTCSCSSCSSCRSYRRSHSYDDCPQCQAERRRRRERRRHRR